MAASASVNSRFYSYIYSYYSYIYSQCVWSSDYNMCDSFSAFSVSVHLSLKDSPKNYDKFIFVFVF